MDGFLVLIIFKPLHKNVTLRFERAGFSAGLTRKYSLYKKFYMSLLLFFRYQHYFISSGEPRILALPEPVDHFSNGQNGTFIYFFYCTVISNIKASNCDVVIKHIVVMK